MKKSVSINGQFITIDEEIKIDLVYKTSACLILENKIITVLENYTPSNENVKCFGYDGELIWTIEAGKWPENRECPVTGIWLKNDKLFVYRWCGFEQEIDLNSGKELHCEFTK